MTGLPLHCALTVTGVRDLAMRTHEGKGWPAVLVAEPQALPGMWLEDVLDAAGCKVIGPFGTSAEAASSLDDTAPDFAVISTDLNQGSGFPLACALRRKGIPFALIAGNAEVPPAFSDVPLFDRLFDGRDMIAAVTTGCDVLSGPQACPPFACSEAGESPVLERCPTACRA